MGYGSVRLRVRVRVTVTVTVTAKVKVKVRVRVTVRARVTVSTLLFQGLDHRYIYDSGLGHIWRLGHILCWARSRTRKRENESQPRSARVVLMCARSSGHDANKVTINTRIQGLFALTESA